MSRRRRWSLGLAAATIVAGVAFGAPSAESDIDRVLDTSYFVLVQAGDRFHYQINRVDLRGRKDLVASKKAVGRPAVSRDGARIAFSGLTGQGDLGLYRLYVMNADGSGLTQITDVVGADMDPAWSPNGKLIAVSRDTSGNLDPSTCCDIVVVDSDGSGEVELPNTAGGRNPAWSPDGEQIAFETPGGLYVIDADGSNRTQVAAAGAREPAWSPSGDEIAFVRATNASESADELVVLDLNSDDESVVFSTGTRVEAPTWAGNAIYFVTYNGYGYDGRIGSRIRAVFPTGETATVFNDDDEVVFASQSLESCYGMSIGGGIGGGSGVEGNPAPGDCMGAATAVGDFDGDGNADVAVGVPGDREAGAVQVLYGTNSGITTSGDQYFDQSILSAGSAEGGDRFGEALAVGDFDGDGFDDLAVGVPGEDVNGRFDAGAFNVIYGSGSGLTVTDGQLFHQDSSGVSGGSERGDRLGQSVAVGDIDGDGYDDLVVGKPGEGLGGDPQVGAISIFYGSSSGLNTVGHESFNQGTSGVRGSNEPFDRFGHAVAVADVDGDGFDDVIVGAPGETVKGKVDAGSIHVLFGSASGVTTGGDQRITTRSSGVSGGPQSGDEFGLALASADFDGDGFADVAIGSPGEDIGSAERAGVVAVLYGTNSGLTGEGDQRFKQNTAGMSGSSESGDRFGSALAAGDIDGDGWADLVIGAPGEGVNGQYSAGAITVIFGSSSGLGTERARRLTEDSGGMRGKAEADDRFGESVAVGDIDDDGRLDVVIGIPGEGVSGIVDAGSIGAIYGTASGVTTSGDDRLTQAS